MNKTTRLSRPKFLVELFAVAAGMMLARNAHAQRIPLPMNQKEWAA